MGEKVTATEAGMMPAEEYDPDLEDLEISIQEGDGPWMVVGSTESGSAASRVGGTPDGGGLHTLTQGLNGIKVGLGKQPSGQQLAPPVVLDPNMPQAAQTLLARVSAQAGSPHALASSNVKGIDIIVKKKPSGNRIQLQPGGWNGSGQGIEVQIGDHVWSGPLTGSTGGAASSGTNAV